MGKKRAAAGGAGAQEGEPDVKERKTRSEHANFSELSQGRLVVREHELAKEARAMQDTLTRARRACGGQGYGSNDVRQLNMKRMRAEYAHAEVRGEIERRKVAGVWMTEPEASDVATQAGIACAGAGGCAGACAAPVQHATQLVGQLPNLAALASLQAPGSTGHLFGSLPSGNSVACAQLPGHLSRPLLGHLLASAPCPGAAGQVVHGSHLPAAFLQPLPSLPAGCGSAHVVAAGCASGGGARCILGDNLHLGGGCASSSVLGLASAIGAATFSAAAPALPGALPVAGIHSLPTGSFPGGLVES